MRVVFAVLSVALLLSCSRQPLELYSERVGKDQLASFHVHTPDPHLNFPDEGQRLVVQWSLTEAEWALSDLHISLKVRFYNGEERSLDLPLNERYGLFILPILNEEFYNTGGLATFKAELFSGSRSLFLWRHQLWNETVDLMP